MGDYQRETMSACKDIFDLHCFHGHGTFKSFVNCIENDLLPMREKLGLEMPWFANETAITSCGDVTKANQAETLYKKLLYAWSRGSKGYIWYNLRAKGRCLQNWEYGYGMLTFDLYPKPVYAAYNALISLYRNKTFKEQLDLGENNWGLVFEKDSETTFCLWTENQTPVSATIKVAGTSAQKYDMFGNATPISITHGTIECTLSGEPFTIVVK